jgi:nickel/cobalt transporter (NiCoT) family protein
LLLSEPICRRARIAATVRVLERRVVLLAGAVGVLHLVGWGLLFAYARSAPALIGLGTLAYTFGLRHAFDADHIAAIDNTTRKLLHDEKPSTDAGFFFSLGHSSVVFALAAGIGLAATTVKARVPSLEHWGAPVGMGVSGAFLVAIGLLNLAVLRDIVGIFRESRATGLDEARLEQRLLDRGLMSRGVLRHVGARVRAGWHLFPLGILFGLGFDTATEVGLLALSAGAAGQHAPLAAVLALPVLFAAGMALLDTADGILMTHAYGWAFATPARKAYYNITVTALSVTVALGIGGVELLQLAAGVVWLDVNRLGFVVAALFVLTWAVSALVWRVRRPDRTAYARVANDARSAT